jgi:hypothetical protein
MNTALLLLVVLAAQAQTRTPLKSPFQTQSTSTIKYGSEKGADVIEVTNVSFEVVSGVPGRTPAEFLMLRKTTRSKEVVGDIGLQASTTVEAWPLGVDPKQKPVYSLTVEGIDPATTGNELLVISRGLEEVEWWSVYKLGTGAHLFDTYTRLLEFAQDHPRYAGVEVPPDDTKDKRLKAPNVVAVVTYASGERVLREALITCDDPKRAQLLRSFADANRTLTYSPSGLRLEINQNYPAKALATITLPVAGDNLDVAHAQVPAGIHVALWTR